MISERDVESLDLLVLVLLPFQLDIVVVFKSEGRDDSHAATAAADDAVAACHAVFPVLALV